MIVLHRCDPENNIFQIYRFDLELYLDHGDLLHHGTREELAHIVIAHGRLRSAMKKRVLGPYHTDHLELLFHEVRPILRKRFKQGYALAVAKGLLADRLNNDLMLVPRVKAWVLAATYEAVQDRKRRTARILQQKNYLESLKNQGQSLLPVIEEDDPPVQPETNPLLFRQSSNRGPTPRSKQYADHIRKLGQLPLFDERDFEELE